MKKLLLSLIGLAISFSLFSQAPSSFNYQAVARNASGDILANASVSLKISILQGSSSGTTVFSEIHSTSTNDFGLLNIEIGHGAYDLGTIAGIDWAAHRHFLKIEMDPGGGQNYSYLGTSELLSVPYALHAKTVESDEVNDADADPTNEIQTLSLDGNELTLSKEGGTVTISGGGGGDDWGSQIVLTDASLEGDGTETTPLKIAQQGAVSGQVLKWDGSSWLPGNDNSGSSFWQQSGNDIFYSSGRIGIGISSPATDFHVHNNQNISDIILTNGNSGTTQFDGLYIFSNDNTSGSGSAAGIVNRESTPLWLGTNNSPHLTIDEAGQVGIRTIHPSADLDVVGQIKIRGGSPGAGKVLTSDASGLATWETISGQGGLTLPYSGEYNSDGPVFSLYHVGNGIGLNVSNNSTSGSSYSIYGVNNSSSGTAIYGFASSSSGETTGVSGSSVSSGGIGVAGIATSSSGTNYGVYGRTSSNTGYSGYFVGGKFYISEYLGIGTLSPSSTLDVNGQVKIRGGSPGDGKVLTSDATGLASWETVSGGGSLSLPFEGEISETGPAFVVKNFTGAAIYGYSSSSNGAPGVHGQVTSTGSGVLGEAVGQTGTTYGIRGLSQSSEGTGAYGYNSSATGVTYGVYGKVNSSNGFSGFFDGGKFHVDGNVGIGTESPSTKLEVTGQVKITGGSPGSGKVLTSDASGLASWQTPSGGSDSDWTISGDDMYSSVSGFVGIGTDTPQAKLQVHSPDNISVISLTNNASGSSVTDGLRMANVYSSSPTGQRYGLIMNGENSILWLGTNNQTILSLTPDESVGIGTGAPTAKLDVQGQIRIRGGFAGAGKVLTSDATGLASWQTPSGGSDSDWTINGIHQYSAVSGNVGIGNSSPSYKLDVLGDRIKIANSGGDWLAMRADGSSGILDITYSDGLLAIQGSADDNNIVLNPSRNSKVGIRMWAPSYTLDVNGDIRATGSVFYGGSAGSANGTAYIKPDFVFTEDYDVLSTDEVEKFVKRKNHLPWLTSAKKEEKEHKDVINLTRMQFESLETIENLQLQIIEMNKKIKELVSLTAKQQETNEKQQRELERLKRKHRNSVL